ncbi:hypothetical protein LXL04_027642 [Taraxacum kok-saghyz]
MGSRGGGGGNNGGGVQGIPAASRKMVQSLKEIVNGVSDAEIYSALKDCNMDPNEAVNRLLTQDPFHEVKSKREKKKEFKDTTESRPRGSSTSSRGGRSGADRYSSRGGSSQFSSSESGGLHGKPRRENGTSSYTSSSAPSYGVSATNINRSTPTYSGSIGYENKPPTYNPPDGPTTVSQPPYQSTWMGGVPGQKSMADIVKMGRPQPQPQPQNKTYNPVTDDYTSKSHEQHPVDDWPSIEHQTQSQTPGVQLSHPQIEQQPDNAVHLDTHHDYINEGVEEEEDEEEDEDEDEGVYEDHVENTNDIYKNMEESFHPDDNNEVETGDVAASSVTANMQQLNLQEERQINEQEDDVLDVVPSVVIPNHLQVQTADCSHLSFGSFGNTMNTTFPGSFTSRHKIEETPVSPDTTQSVGPSETRNPEYYGDESLMASENRQAEVMKQENADVAHGNINNNNNNNNNNQYSFSSSTPGQGYSFDSTQLLNPSFPQSQTPTQMQTATPFSNIVQQQGGAYTNSLPSTLLAGNGHLVGDADLSYSPFPISQQIATKYGSISEALKTGVFSSSSSSQPTQQTPPGNAIPPALPQHLTVHPYSQPALPLGPFANMIGYPFLPQSYTYMPSGFQQTYHQQLGQLAAVLPQYKNSVSVSSLPQSAAVPSGYGAFGNSGTVPGNYQVNQPAGGSGLSYDDVLNAHYKESSQLLSLQQQNDSSAMWVHGAGSRTMSAVPASTYYSFQGQSQQPAGFRQGQQQQQAGQTYGGGAAGNYQNYYHSQAGMSPEQNRGGVGGGSQGQPKGQQQSQQLWQNSY